MNIALLIAGGSGVRMHQDIPKQFINVYEKPILVYTMEAFQKHPDIDAIYVVCIDGWHDILQAYARQFGITKLKEVVAGGKCGQESIRNGIYAIEKNAQSNDLVLVHDAIRPMVTSEIISDTIAKCVLYGSAIASIPCAEAILYTENNIDSELIHPREKLMRTQTPQAFPLWKLLWAHRMAAERGISHSVASCTLMIELGEKVYFSAGSEKNIKITTIDDLDIFKALLLSRQEA